MNKPDDFDVWRLPDDGLVDHLAINLDRARKIAGCGIDNFLCEGDFFLRRAESIIDGGDLRGVNRRFSGKTDRARHLRFFARPDSSDQLLVLTQAYKNHFHTPCHTQTAPALCPVLRATVDSLPLVDGFPALTMGHQSNASFGLFAGPCKKAWEPGSLETDQSWNRLAVVWWAIEQRTEQTIEILLRHNKECGSS